jgi:hypothetical protein
MEHLQVKLILKGRPMEDIDPLNEMTVIGDHIVIDNGYSVYEYRLDKIIRIEIVPMEIPNGA